MLNERIAAARKAAGLTTRELGEMAGVSAMSISKYENGKAAPSSDVLLRLARALGVKTEYFFRQTNVQLEGLEFRKHPKLPKRLEQRIEANALDQVERFLDLVRRFPNPPIKKFVVPALGLRAISDLEQIEDIAARIRKDWRLGDNPISDLSDTFEQHGIRVFQTDLAGDEHFAGLAARVDGMPVVVISSQHPGDRQRFTLAHELGHLIFSGIKNWKAINVEKAADRFAGAFLAPKNAVIEKLGAHRSWLEPRELWNLKIEFGLSMGGWVHRARDLGIIPVGTYFEIWKMFKENGWNRTEPFGQLPSERPRLMQSLVLRALSEALVGESKAAELLGMPVKEFHSWKTGQNDTPRSQ